MDIFLKHYLEKMTENAPAKRIKLSENNVNESAAATGFNAAIDQTNAADFVITEKSIPLLPRDATILLLDIEGCTTSISFVHDILFPFVLSNLDSYLSSVKPEDLDEIATALKADVAKLEETNIARKEIEMKSSNDSLPREIICIHVKGMMNHDVKATGLKSLQGKMWKNGYNSDELKGHIYEDFPMLLNWCKEQNVSVNIYSSGSIGAQKLLFGHSTKGDLCSNFQNHFDTTSGGKKDSGSYINIAKDLGVDPSKIMFVSDAEAELVAARKAGIGFPVMSVRPGNAPLTEIGEEFPIIFSLLQLCGSGK